jgi:hypothetical protein
MITILGIKVSYETLAFFILFIASEYLGMTKKRRSNSVTQAISMAAAYFSKTRTEDDTVRDLANPDKGFIKLAWSCNGTLAKR